MQKTRINISHATPRPTARNTNVSEKLPLYTASLCTRSRSSRNKTAKASRTAQDNLKALFEPLIWSNANILHKITNPPIGVNYIVLIHLHFFARLSQVLYFWH